MTCARNLPYLQESSLIFLHATPKSNKNIFSSWLMIIAPAIAPPITNATVLYQVAFNPSVSSQTSLTRTQTSLPTLQEQITITVWHF